MLGYGEARQFDGPTLDPPVPLSTRSPTGRLAPGNPVRSSKQIAPLNEGVLEDSSAEGDGCRGMLSVGDG